jgi:hypothetical protein
MSKRLCGHKRKKRKDANERRQHRQPNFVLLFPDPRKL